MGSMIRLSAFSGAFGTIDSGRDTSGAIFRSFVDFRRRDDSGDRGLFLLCERNGEKERKTEEVRKGAWFLEKVVWENSFSGGAERATLESLLWPWAGWRRLGRRNDTGARLALGRAGLAAGHLHRVTAGWLVAASCCSTGGAFRVSISRSNATVPCTLPAERTTVVPSALSGFRFTETNL